MRTPTMAARLLRESDELHGFWECCNERVNTRTDSTDAEEMALIYATLLMTLPEGLERLRKAWVLDRLDMEETAPLARRQAV